MVVPLLLLLLAVSPTMLVSVVVMVVVVSWLLLLLGLGIRAYHHLRGIAVALMRLEAGSKGSGGGSSGGSGSRYAVHVLFPTGGRGRQGGRRQHVKDLMLAVLAIPSVGGGEG